MIKAADLNPHIRLLFAAVASLAILFAAQMQVAAQTETCRVGTRVQTDVPNTEGHVGTITEIGTEAPHVGWYRIVYEWNVRSGNPKGEWYNPKNWEVRVAGTNTRCGLADAADRPQSAEKTNKATPPGQKAPGGSPEQDGCPMGEPPGKVTKSSPASAQLFKRVIYEKMAARVSEASISAPKRIGLTFLDFELGRAYKNTLTSDRLGDKRLHDGAPVGAMIYPIKTKYLKCELYDRSITRWVIQQNFACFKDRFGDWVCPTDSVPKFLEQRSIPIK